MYLRLCGEELEVQLYTATPRGVPIPQMAHEGPEGIAFLCRCAGRSWKFNHTRPPHGASLSPKRPKQDRRNSGVAAAGCGGSRNPIVHGTPTGRPYPPNGPSKTGGTRVYPPL